MQDTKNTTTSTATNKKMTQGMKKYILFCLAVCTNVAYVEAQDIFPQGAVGDLTPSKGYVLTDAVFNGDGTVQDLANSTNTGAHTAVTPKGKPTTKWNEDFGRFSFVQNGTWGGTPTSWYEWNYNTEKYGEEDGIANGCTLEVLIKTPSDVTSNPDKESKILSATEKGGIGLLISSNTPIDEQNQGGKKTANAITLIVGVSESGKNKYYWCSAPTAVQKDTYYHVVGVYGGKDKYLHLYINGEKVTEVTGVTGEEIFKPNTNPARFCIGADPAKDALKAEATFPGEILIARVYKTRVSESNIRALYNNIKIKRTQLKADLMDIVFDGQGIARDVSDMNNVVTAWQNPTNTSAPTELKETPITTSGTYAWEPKFDYNYGRYVLNNKSIQYWGTYAKNYYRVDYKDNAKMKKALQDGFTMEVIANCTDDPTRTDKGHSNDEAEAKWFSSVQAGGTSIMAGVANANPRDDRMNFVVHTTGVDHYIGTDITDNTKLTTIGSNYAAEIGREANTMSQTINNLPAGKYKVVCQGFQTGGSIASLYAKSGDNTVKKSLAVMSDATLLNNNIEADKATFSEDIADNVTNLRNYNTNAAAARLMASSGTTRAGETYSNEVTIDVANGSLEIGLVKENAEGRAYVDNFQLFKVEYNKQLYLSATKAEQASRDCRAYHDEKVSFILRRAFDRGQWNALSLPCNIPGSELKKQFGDDVQLYKLVGIDEDSKSVIRFTKVELNSEGEGLKANECYVIKPTKLCENTYDYSQGTPYTYRFIDDKEDTELSTYSPLYFFNNVTQPDAYEKDFTKNYSTTSGTLKFTAYYGKPTSVAAYSYIVENGDMYYLQNAYNNLFASYWTLEDVANPTKSYRMMIDDDNESTGISASELIPVADNRMYNLNGQRIANDAKDGYLPKGIYITNGRKVVVR